MSRALQEITIKSSETSVAISSLGAELQCFCDSHGRQYLHDKKMFWTGRAPLLFPIIGAIKNSRHQLDGSTYMLPRHGFARIMNFDLVETANDRATYRLEDNAKTRAQYPYQFRLDVTHSVSGAKLATSARVTNMDSRPIPVAFGFHPAFRWPLPGIESKADQIVEFTEEEVEPISRLDADGLVSRTQPTPVEGKRLVLRDSLF